MTKKQVCCWYGLFICLETIVNISIVDNIAIFKMPLIDGAETVSTVLNNLKFDLGNYR
jgi:hypothetical protein